MTRILFTGWDPLIRTLVIGVLAYASLVIILRVSGKRTLSKMNAFDLVVTVALGSTLATILLNRNVTWAQGTLAFAVLVGLQFLVTWTSVRVGWLRRIVTGEPSLLFYQGTYLREAMRKARVTESEVRAAIRAQRLTDLQEVEGVVLETDGTFSVVCRPGHRPESSSLSDVQTPG